VKKRRRRRDRVSAPICVDEDSGKLYRAELRDKLQRRLFLARATDRSPLLPRVAMSASRALVLLKWRWLTATSRLPRHGRERWRGRHRGPQRRVSLQAKIDKPLREIPKGTDGSNLAPSSGELAANSESAPLRRSSARVDRQPKVRTDPLGSRWL